jgi:DNA-binding NarL/FixJ family response regulator
MSLAVETPGAPAEPSAGIAVCAEDVAVRSRIRNAVAGSARHVVASADDVEAMIDGCDRPAPACVILAGKRPDKTMGEAAARIHAEFGEAPIVAVCVRAGAGDVRRAIGFGVDGVVLEQRIEGALEPVVSAVCNGQTCVPSGRRNEVGAKVLTNREKQMLTLVAGGMTNSEIASTLFLAESTVKSHLSSAFGKLNVSSRHEAASVVLDPERARALGIILGPEHRSAEQRVDQPSDEIASPSR